MAEEQALASRCEGKVLVVDDDLALLETMECSLADRGYQVSTAADGRAAVELARQERPDALVLDVMLPGLDGFEVCRILRREMSVPILMLTARAGEVDKIVGLEVGADDCVTKPFSMQEFLARVNALLRRVRLIRKELAAERAGVGLVATPGGTLAFGDLTIDQARREVLQRGKPLHLKPKEYDLLVCLARGRGSALSRDLILDQVWGGEYDGAGRTVDVHVRWLRGKIEADPTHPRRILTVRGVGYRFEG